jgi:hypothetical protein
VGEVSPKLMGTYRQSGSPDRRTQSEEQVALAVLAKAKILVRIEVLDVQVGEEE